MDVLSTLAFAALIGAQFLAAIVLISRRKTIYADPRARIEAETPQPDRRVQAETPQPDRREPEVVEAERPAKAA